MVKIRKAVKIDEIPKLICTRMPKAGLNNGEYTVRIPLKYMIKAYEAPAAFFEFKFIGLRKER